MTGQRLTDLSFEDWLEHEFGHAVPLHGQAWHFEPDADWWEPSPEQAITYVSRLFREPERLMVSFADSQIAQGFWHLLSGDVAFALLDDSLPVDMRCDAIRAMSTIFGRIFDPRCAPLLSHLDEPGTNALNGICYMWWDVLPLYGEATDQRANPIDDACLGAMHEILSLPNPACQESALHGLGHWQSVYPAFAAATIDAYLAASPGLRPELVVYAQAARSGCVN